MKGTLICIEKGLGIYTHCVRSSFYVDGAEPGVKIACDLYLPSDDNGKIVSDPMPLVLHAGAGDRRQDQAPEITFTMVANGYAHMMCDNRSVGASVGISNSFAGLDQASDIKCVIEWAAAQPWCNGKVAMRGISNKGFIQLTTACTFPEHLVGITPIVCSADVYNVNRRGGVNCEPKMFIASGIPKIPKRLDMGTPVDDDPAPWYPWARKAALEREKKQLPWYEKVTPDNKCRDWIDPTLGYAPNLVDAPVEYLDKLKKRGYRVQQFAGWFDADASMQLMLHNVIGDHIIVGPWSHPEGNNGHSVLPEGTMDFAKEHLRWFDECLKGIPGGRAPVTYYTMNAPEGQRWKESDVWPPKGFAQIPFYLGRDGSLSPVVPDEGEYKYTVTNDVVIFEPWGRMNSYITRDMNPECDSKSMTFTTEPLEKDIEVTGHSVAELWVSSTAEDGNFAVVLEDVAPDGNSHFITIGYLRASHRKESADEMYNGVGVPHHRSLEADMLPMEPGVPVRLAFAIDATSYFFPKGHRIRVTVTCGEKAQMQQPECIDMENPPEVILYTGGVMASRVMLSVSDGNY